MEINELGHMCQNVLASAVAWRQEQGELMQAIHSSTLFVIHEEGEARRESVMEALREEYSDLLLGYSEAETGAAVREFLESEFSDLSGIFAKLYAEFNERYFAWRLPAHRVIVMHAAPGAKLKSNLALVDEQLREIVIVYDGRPEEMVSLLLDTMAHIAAGADAESAWQKELARLYDLGAPTRRRVEELDDAVEWPCERARCCVPKDRLGWQLRATESKHDSDPAENGDAMMARQKYVARAHRTMECYANLTGADMQSVDPDSLITDLLIDVWYFCSEHDFELHDPFGWGLLDTLARLSQTHTLFSHAKGSR